MRTERGKAIPNTPDDRSATPAWARRVIGTLSPAGSSARLTVLIFHRVHERPDSIFPDEMHASSFRARMRWVGSAFNVLPLGDGVAALARGTLPARALAITFDDGYADNATTALPILQSMGLHATFFVATSFLDGGRMWNDTVIESVRHARTAVLDLSTLGLGVHRIDSPQACQSAIGAILRQIKYLPPEERLDRVDAIARLAAAELPTKLMMTGNELRGLAAAGMGIGGHTMTHPILARLDDAKARREVADGRDALEAMIRQPVKLFAYPNGKPDSDYTAGQVKMVRDLGFAAAFSTAPGAARRGASLHELPRFTPWDRTRARWTLRLARNLFTRTPRASA